MSDYYSVYCEEEMADMEVNAYYLTQEKALKMAMDLLDEGNEEVAIVNMSKRLKEKVLAHLGEEADDEEV